MAKMLPYCEQINLLKTDCEFYKFMPRLNNNQEIEKYIFLIFLSFLIISSKKNTPAKYIEKEVVIKKYDKINHINWLLGTWTNETDGEYSQETWTKENDSTYTGFSFVEVNGKPEQTVTMALEAKENKLFFSFLKVDEKKP